MCNRTDCYGSFCGPLSRSVCRERDMIDAIFWWVGCVVCAGGAIVGIIFVLWLFAAVALEFIRCATFHYLRGYVYLYVRFRRFVQHWEVKTSDLCECCKGSGVKQSHVDAVLAKIPKKENVK